MTTHTKTAIILLTFFSLITHLLAREPTAKESKLLGEMSEDYYRWSMTGYPKSFYERFDLKEIEEERKLAVEMAKIEGYSPESSERWLKRGIKNPAVEVPKLSTKEYWKLLNKPINTDWPWSNTNSDPSKVKIKVVRVKIELDRTTNKEVATVSFDSLHNGTTAMPEVKIWQHQFVKINGVWKPCRPKENITYMKKRLKEMRPTQTEKIKKQNKQE